MDDALLTSFVADVWHQFWHPDQIWVIAGGLVLWLILRRLLPEGSQYVLKQTVAFFVLALLGQLGASLMRAMGWSTIAGGLYELTVIAAGIALIRFGGMLIFRWLMPALRIGTPRILEDITVVLAYGM